MQPTIKRQDETSGFYLYSFAPASGVGFYLTKDEIVKFDLVTKEQSPLQGTALMAQRAEFDQVDAEAYFTSYEELVSFTSEEYLRDKKNTLYALLFTRDLGEELNTRTLQLLNEPGFGEVGFSERAIPILSEIAQGDRVSSVVQLAYELGLTNVQGCLSNELSALTFDSVSAMIDEAQHTDLARGRAYLFEKSLGLLRSYVSAVRTVPGSAYQSIMTFCNYAERNVALLSAKGIGSLSSLLTRLERSSPAVNYAQAIAFNKPRLISQTFTAALFESEAETVTALSSRLNELHFDREDELVAAGKQFLDLGVRWVVPPFGPGLPFVEMTTEQDKTIRNWVRSVARDIYLRQRNQNKFNRTRSNFQFSIDFALPDNLFSVSQNLPWYAENVSFWLAFYADPDRALDRFYFIEPNNPHWFIENLFDQIMRFPSRAMSDQSLFSFYNASNLLSLAVMYTEVLYGSEDRDIARRLILRIFETRRDSRLPEAFDILFSNLLAAALQRKQYELVNYIVAYLRDRRDEKLTLSPFIRIIL